MNQYYNTRIPATSHSLCMQQGKHILACDFFTSFITSRMKDAELSPRTLQSNLSEYRCYIAPYMQGVYVSEITPQYLSEFYRYLHAQGGKDNTALSAATVRHVHALISKAFNASIERGELVYNPANQAKIPKGIRKEAFCLSPQEFARLIKITKDSGVALSFGIFLLAITGMRRGELLALTWADIDFLCATISITKARGNATKEICGKERIYTREPKSYQSNRMLALDVHFLSCVESYKEKQRARLKRLSIDQTSTTPIIDKDGQAYDPDTFTHNAQVFFELFEFDRRTHIHTLRHSCISMLIRAGVDSKAVSTWAGHASITTTLDTYAHVFSGSKHETAGRLWRAYLDVLNGCG